MASHVWPDRVPAIAQKADDEQRHDSGRGMRPQEISTFTTATERDLAPWATIPNCNSPNMIGRSYALRRKSGLGSWV
jgi:hypothetical protein